MRNLKPPRPDGQAGGGRLEVNYAADIRRGLALLAVLHRDPKAMAAFAGPLNGDWCNLFGLTRSELLDPPFTETELAALETNVYVSLHGMRPAKGKTRAKPFKGRRSGKRGNDVVAVLNAAWVDFDAYKVGLSADEVLEELRRLRDQGQLPPWSLDLDSGRGVWVLWFLRADDSTDLPPEATPANKDACRRINAALVERFRHLGADGNSTDLARVARVPFTRNAKAVAEGLEGIVRWELAKPLPYYTIAELADVFLADESVQPARGKRRGYQQRRSACVDRRTCRTKRAPRGRPFSPNAGDAAARQRWGLPLLDLLSLAFYRGGFKKGHRHYAVFWLARLLNLALPPEPGKLSDIYRICEEVNAEFTEPLPPATVKRQVLRATSWKPAGHVSNRALAAKFDVTDEEAALLRKLKPGSAETNSRDARRETVSAVRQDWIEAKGSPPTLDELAREVALAGHSVSPATVCRDLRALGYARRTAAGSPASRGGREEKTSAKNEKAAVQRKRRRERA